MDIVPSPHSTDTVCFPSQGLGVYNVSKTALLGLTRTLAMELAPKGIRVNCLVPGLIKTSFSQVVRTQLSRLPLGGGGLKDKGMNEASSQHPQN